MTFVHLLKDLTLNRPFSQVESAIKNTFSRLDVFGNEVKYFPQDLLLINPELQAMKTPQYWGKMDSILKHIDNHFWTYIEEIDQTFCLPVERKCTIRFIPGFFINYAPRLGEQIFSIKVDANPEEVVLFLAHVYYHEVTNYFEEHIKVKRSNDNEANQFKYLLLSLIMNEGIANYAVLDRLNIFLNEVPESYSFKYFKYARLIHHQETLESCFTLFNQIITKVNEQNYSHIKHDISKYLKNEKLPIINLIGIHTAINISEKYGVKVFKEIMEQGPYAYFEKYLSIKPHQYLNEDVINYVGRMGV
jgi:hypothetical protein